MPSLRSKKGDPISERTRALNAEIAALEAQIQELGSQLELAPLSQPPPAAQSRSARVEEPVFEPVHHARVAPPGPTAETRAPAADSGGRKSDLAGTLQRFKKPFREPAPSNPRLISYLAAGSIQGLRPLRYEKRVARNRVVFLALLLLFVLWGLIAVLRP